MELYEAVLNDVLCCSPEQQTVYIVRTRVPVYQLVGENAEPDASGVDFSQLRLDVRYNDGKFTRFNLVCAAGGVEPYVVNLLVRYDMIEILKFNLAVVESRRRNGRGHLYNAEYPYRVITLDELERRASGSRFVCRRIGAGYEPCGSWRQ